VWHFFYEEVHLLIDFMCSI